MLSFFSRKPINSKLYYDTKLAKYVIDTTNRVKKEYPIVPYTNKSNQYVASNLPIISILSFLAGYYLAKYNN